MTTLKFLVYGQKQKILTMLSLTAGNTSSALCSTIFEFLLQKNTESFITLIVLLSHIALGVANDNIYKNPTD
jgi:hypothetical protein